MTDYVGDIYNYLHQLDLVQSVTPDYLSGHLHPRKRAVLVDWLVEVHHQFNLLQETLYLTVALINRYLSCPGVVAATQRSHLQLIGVTAIFVASKYEEIYTPEIGDFVYITDNAYTKQQIRSLEVDMLTSLCFSLSWPLPLHFLRRYSKAGQVDAKLHTLAKYIMELSLYDYSLAATPPSLLAGSTLLLGLKLLALATHLPTLWTPNLVHYTNYTLPDLEYTVYKLAGLVATKEVSKQQAVRKKYPSKRFVKIALLPQLKDAGDNVKTG